MIQERTRLSRASAIAGTAMFLASVREAWAQAPLETIRVASNPVADVVPLLYAQSSGLFRSAGLDVTLQRASNGSAVAAALAGGAIEIGKVASTTIVSAHVHGVGLTIVFPDRLHTSGAQSQTQLIVEPQSPIRNGRDLNGKTVAVSAVKDSTWIGARMFVDAAGGDSASVRFIEIPFSAVGAAVAAGRVDAGVDNTPYLEKDVASGRVRALGDIFAAMGSNFLETAWVANAEYIKKNPQTISRFARAIRDAQVWCNAHPSDANEITAKFTGVDKAALDATKTIFATEINPRAVQSYITAAAKYQVIPSAFDAAELFAKS